MVGEDASERRADDHAEPVLTRAQPPATVGSTHERTKQQPAHPRLMRRELPCPQDAFEHGDPRPGALGDGNVHDPVRGLPQNEPRSSASTRSKPKTSRPRSRPSNATAATPSRAAASGAGSCAWPAPRSPRLSPAASASSSSNSAPASTADPPASTTPIVHTTGAVMLAQHSDGGVGVRVVTAADHWIRRGAPPVRQRLQLAHAAPRRCGWPEDLKGILNGAACPAVPQGRRKASAALPPEAPFIRKTTRSLPHSGYGLCSCCFCTLRTGTWVAGSTQKT